MCLPAELRGPPGGSGVLSVVLELLTCWSAKQEETKVILIRKEEMKQTNTIVYLENSKELTKKLGQLVSEFSKCTRYKVSRQKPTLGVALLG